MKCRIENETKGNVLLIKQLILSKINYIFILEFFSQKLKLVRYFLPYRPPPPPRKTDHPLVHPRVIKRRIRCSVPPPLFFLSIYFRKKRATRPRYLHRVCSS